ncbi:MAG: ABC transporter substrate-binding protein [Acidimicrobiales bacterium]
MLDRVKLSLWCPGCLPGYQLPFYSASLNGLFAEYDLLVEILDPPPPPGTRNADRVADGEADFSLTAVSYFLMAQGKRPSPFGARFIGVVHHKTPFGVVVMAGSDIETIDHLAGRVLGRSTFNDWAVRECTLAMADKGVGPPECVGVDHFDFSGSLLRGEIDMRACFTDTLAVLASTLGAPLRRVELGLDIYGSGLIASDRVSDDVAWRMAQATSAALELQRSDPGGLIAEFCKRFPRRDPEVVRHSWDLLVPYAFPAGGAGSMSADRWTASLAWYRRAHGLAPRPLEEVVRPDLLEALAAAE